MNAFYQLLTTNTARNPERTAIIDGERRIDYAEVEAEVERAAGWLVEVGVKPGDRVGVHLLKGLEEIAAMFAINSVGAVFVNINRQWTEAQLEFVLEDAGVIAIFMEGSRAKKLIKSERGLGNLHVCATGKAPEFAGVSAWAESYGPAPVNTRAEHELAAILYTSGSTGKPKGVMLTNKNILIGAESVAQYLGNRCEDRVLSLLPYSFDYGLSQLTTMFLVGGSVVLMRAMMPTEIAKTMVEHEVTGLPVLPSVWVPLVRLLLEHPVAFPKLRYLTNTGGKIPDATLRALPEVFPGTEIFLMYGLTEAFRSTFLSPDKFAAKMGSIGSAIPNVETFVIDASIGVCGPGDQGELVHRGPLLSLGYWNRPEDTDAVIKPCPELAHLIGDEKVLYSGDLVRIDEDGDYWFVGRRDGLIKSSGYRISPTEIEDVVSDSGLVTEVIAFGTPDEDLGEAVTIAACCEEDELEEMALMKYCRQKLAGYMTPKFIHHWPGSFPRTANGKLDRVLVKKTCLAK